VACGGLRFFRIVEFLAGRAGTRPLTGTARYVLEASVQRWNEAASVFQPSRAA
jgi:hypothetical protein